MSDITLSNLPHAQAPDPVVEPRCVRGQNRSCRKQGSAKVIAAHSYPVAGVTVRGSSCLGKCGNGPMVMVLPDQVWYSRVQPAEVLTVVKRHLQAGPVAAMLYPQFHPNP